MTASLPPAELLSKFAVSDPEWMAETALATVWRVRCSDGGQAALKVYADPGMANEAPGFAFLEALDGDGIARLLGRTPGAVLIEWLPGPSLGDLVREGQDERAAHELVAVANRLHRRERHVAAELPTLDQWFSALFDIRVSLSCPPTARRDLMFCRDLAGRLCASQQDIRPLHGDLHHDNIRMSARGPLAFDAKGVLGERCYELANAFRNPRGVPRLIRDPGRVRLLRDLWSDRFGVRPRRLMEWAAAKCALSICWRSATAVEPDPELDLLAVLIAVLRETERATGAPPAP